VTVAHEFRLPDIGEGLTEAEIIRWLVPVGGTVEIDAPLVEVETDKAVVEIPSPFGGVVLRHGAEEGDTIKVGSVLVVIGEADERIEEPERSQIDESRESHETPIVGTLDAATETLPPRDTQVRALPVVRRLARELGVDLAGVRPTGPGGKITREDVIRSVPEASERVQMSRLRRTIARRMERSWREIPHVTTFDEVDVSRMMSARAALAKRYERSVSWEALSILAVIPVLRRFPEFNATLEGDDLVVHHRYDIGIAVDTPEGLIVPVVRDADHLDLMGLSSEVERLSVAAKERSLVPDEVAPPTFTVSNIGAVGGGFGTPIIPYGTTAILSIGRAADKPVVRNGAIVIAPMVPLSLSYDHRVVDGGLGRRFMAMVMQHLEEPALFLA
jgi:pyruvate dehydrogenase E2 component (dihydrolipoamide acetyltransferase)